MRGNHRTASDPEMALFDSYFKEWLEAVRKAINPLAKARGGTMLSEGAVYGLGTIDDPSLPKDSTITVVMSESDGTTATLELKASFKAPWTIERARKLFGAEDIEFSKLVKLDSASGAESALQVFLEEVGMIAGIEASLRFLDDSGNDQSVKLRNVVWDRLRTEVGDVPSKTIVVRADEPAFFYLSPTKKYRVTVENLLGNLRIPETPKNKSAVLKKVDKAMSGASPIHVSREMVARYASTLWFGNDLRVEFDMTHYPVQSRQASATSVRLAYADSMRKRAVSEIRVGSTVEQGSIRIHRYSDWTSVTDLTNAGKRGKTVEVIGFRLNRYFADAYYNLFAGPLQACENMAQVHILANTYALTDPDEPRSDFVTYSEQRGVDVVPSLKQVIKLQTTNFTLSASPLDFTVRDSSRQGQVLHPLQSSKKRSALTFYAWLQENLARVQDMTVTQIAQELLRKKIQYDSYSQDI